MFAVPGWTVAADGPKTENVAAQSGGKGKKRKRPEAPAVTSDNLETMWDKVIEGKKPGQDGSKKRKRGKNGSGASKKAAAKTGENAEEKTEVNAEGKAEKESEKKVEKVGGEAGDKPAKKADKKEKNGKKDKAGQESKAEETAKVDKAEATEKPGKKGKKGKKDAKPTDTQDAAVAQPSAPQPAAAQVLPALPTPAKLTPLQAAMRAKLIPARFRHLNETLYTRPSAEAFKLFQDSPEMFDEYHAGFRQQVGVWPENPVDGYVDAVRRRGAVRDRYGDKRQGRGKPQEGPAPGGVAPLPRTGRECTIADLGCGDARLATVLAPEAEKLRVKVLSYDLQSPSPLVTRADIANLPIESDSVNVAVFCLALMGTNWLDFIEEAHRILHWKGELWVAEIKSRFSRKKPAAGAPVAHSVGNRKKAATPAAAPAKDFTQDLAVEVDGMEDKRNETDVSAFVEALRKRGFVLRGEGTSEVQASVDLSNKMFVRMHFIKGTAPTVGKGAVAKAAVDKAAGRNRFVKKGKAEEDEEEEVDEAAILKPCVYKLR